MSALGVALVTALAPAGVAAPQARVELGPLLRVQTPGGTATTCPFESEPELTSTAAGTWVAYNDDVGCPMYGAGKATRMTGLQLVPPHGPRRDITLPALHGDERYAGDPDLAPAPDGRGGVLLSTLVASRADNAYRVAVVDVSRTGRARLLPSPSLGTSDDKEFLAVDNNPRSRFRGRVYLAWDDFANAATTVRVRRRPLEHPRPAARRRR